MVSPTMKQSQKYQLAPKIKFIANSQNEFCISKEFRVVYMNLEPYHKRIRNHDPTRLQREILDRIFSYEVLDLHLQKYSTSNPTTPRTSLSSLVPGGPGISAPAPVSHAL